jgi:hypothetical protein
LLPSHYLSHSIQSIHLKWDDAWGGRYFLYGVPTYNLEGWNRCWKIAADMKALKHVQVDIAVKMIEHEEDFFIALVDIAHRVTVEVSVSWETGEKEQKEWPFTVRRGVGGLFRY